MQPDDPQDIDKRAVAAAVRWCERIEPVQLVERLPGGLLNYIWRIGRPGVSVVVKIYPPYAASHPEVTLDPARGRFEALALGYFAHGGELASLASPRVRPPRLIGADPDAPVVVMEDLGPAPDAAHLSLFLSQSTAGELLEELGRFIGQMHESSTGLIHHDNRAVQESRLEHQYRAVASMLHDQPDARELGREAEDLGTRLLERGQCLIMGDLWPRSILVTSDRALRLVDWELSHYGHPLQDLAHLAAHLRLHEIYAGFSPGKLEGLFGRGYQDARPGYRWTDREPRDAVVHAACELLMRSRGPFRLDWSGGRIERVTQHALALLRGNQPLKIFE